MNFLLNYVERHVLWSILHMFTVFHSKFCFLKNFSNSSTFGYKIRVATNTQFSRIYFGIGIVNQYSVFIYLRIIYICVYEMYSWKLSYLRTYVPAILAVSALC